MEVMEYRICKNEAPHRKDWWTVERLFRERTFFFFRSSKWRVVKECYVSPVGFSSCPRSFASEEEAREWVAEDKRPRIHKCFPA